MPSVKKPADLIVVGSAATLVTAIVYLINSLTRASAYVRVTLAPAVVSELQEQTLRIDRASATVFAGGLTGSDRAFIRLPLVVALTLVSVLLFCAYLQLRWHPTLSTGRALLTPGAAGTAIGLALAALGVLPAAASVMTTIVMLDAANLGAAYEPVLSPSWGWVAAGAVYAGTLRSVRSPAAGQPPADGTPVAGGR